MAKRRRVKKGAKQLSRSEVLVTLIFLLSPLSANGAGPSADSKAPQQAEYCFVGLATA